MILAIDIGNTNTVFGLFSSTAHAPDVTWRFSSVRDRTADEWRSLLLPQFVSAKIPFEAISGAIISSVVPAIGKSLVELARRDFAREPILVGPHLDLGIELAVDSPQETGADRIVNSAYAYAFYGGPTIVVDLGTATKIEAVTEDGRFVGGVIAPGLGLSLDALATRAARLYAVELNLPEHAIGRNTVAAVQAGVVAGHLAMIEGMVARVSQELGPPSHVVLTGGFSGTLAGSCAIVTDYAPDLTMRGLAYLFARNMR